VRWGSALLLGLGAALLGCVETPQDSLQRPDLEGAADSGPPATPPRPDGGPRVGPNPGPVRRLVRWSPLGTLPAENLVMNPSLDVLSSLAPVGAAPLLRYVWPRTPAGQPVLQIPVSDAVIVPVQSRPGGLRAEAWIGARERPPQARVSVVGKGRQDGLPAVVVELRAVGAPVTLDGVIWQRVAVETDHSFMGQYHLMAANQSVGPVFLTGPQVTPRTLGVAPGAATAPLGRPRALAPEEAATLAERVARAATTLRDRLAAPDLQGRLGSRTTEN
jgi:hypothetical protein